MYSQFFNIKFNQPIKQRKHINMLCYFKAYLTHQLKT